MTYMSSAVGGEEIKFVSVNATADGDNTVISAVAGKKLVVWGYLLTGTAAGTATLQNTAASPVVLAPITFTANQLFVNYSGGMSAPAFETPVGTGLEINNTAGLDTKGHLCYSEVE